MKALIFNSGLGKRMGEYTKDRPKSMVPLKNGESIFERQIRILEECGIEKFVVTTGPYPEKLQEIAKKHPNSKFQFVPNPIYDKTNCIYSFYLTSQYLTGDFVTLHGDLVFQKKTIEKIIQDPHGSCVAIDSSKPLPEKDFKARLSDGKVSCISVNIFGNDCVSLQPMYKISEKDMNTWITEVSKYIDSGKCNVYAEEAFNSVSHYIPLFPVDCKGYFVEEIDNPEDYKKVSNEIALLDVQDQTVLRSYEALGTYLKNKNLRKVLLVASKRSVESQIGQIISSYTEPVIFNAFSPNPQYHEAVCGRKIFLENNCDSIISIGGGSAIDVAKCILAFSKMDEGDYTSGSRTHRHIFHLAIPTTAGTGSESTKYATIYKNGKKYSISGEDEIPETIVLIPELIKTMPESVKSSTLFDALCQCIESIWSVNAISESKEYASRGIELILANVKEYYANDEKSFSCIQEASNLSGRAINITQTTAAHALSYVLTSDLNIPHGIAVARCIIPLWKLLITKPHSNECENALNSIDSLFGGSDHQDTIECFSKLVENLLKLSKLNLTENICERYSEMINIQRLSNFPICLTKEEIISVYKEL